MKTHDIAIKAIYFCQLLVAFLILAVACQAQNTNQPAGQHNPSAAMLPPGASVTVQKYTDDKGRVIKYDSVFSYKWSDNHVQGRQRVLYDFRQLGHAGAPAELRPGNKPDKAHQSWSRKLMEEWMKSWQHYALPAQPDRHKTQGTVKTL